MLPWVFRPDQVKVLRQQLAGELGFHLLHRAPRVWAEASPAGSELLAEDLLVEILRVDLERLRPRGVELARELLVHLEQRLPGQDDARERQRVQPAAAAASCRFLS